MFWTIFIAFVAVVIVYVIIKNKETNLSKEIAKDTVAKVKQDYNLVEPLIHYTYQNIASTKYIEIHFFFDEKTRTFVAYSVQSGAQKYSFDDIIGCEIVSDGQVTGQIGRAIVGSMIAGGAGAVVGAMTAKKKEVSSYKLMIFLNNIGSPTLEYPLITMKCKTDDQRYLGAVAFAENVKNTIGVIIYNNSNK